MQTRESRTPLPNAPVDLLIVGGGINGAGIACDAAGRGLSVVLCERDDLASATSSASSKLIHGGLRYLEHFAFRLVREALSEREILLAKAPHLVRPIRFILPLTPDSRPAWMVRLGLWLYDHLGVRRSLPASEAVDLRNFGGPLKPWIVRGFSYADAWVDDARLVVANAQGAAEAGAHILTRTELVSAQRDGTMWRARLCDRRTGREAEVSARALVNAAGPWVEQVRGRASNAAGGHRVRLVKGSHIVVPRLHPGPEAFVLQNDDGRVVFVIPFGADFSLVGTTEVTVEGDATGIAADPAEISYLCEAVGQSFSRAPTPADVVWSFAGVRPLWDDAARDASSVTRDYALELDAGGGEAPLLSVFGGKITTYRRLAEQTLAKLAPHLPQMGPAWTKSAILPGGDLPEGDAEDWAADFAARHAWLPGPLARRFAASYGSRAEDVLAGAQSLADLGVAFGAGLYAREVDYLIAHEWAETADDILWRRSKLGLHIPEDGVRALADRLAVEASLPQPHARRDVDMAS